VINAGLKITLETDEPLSGVEVEIAPHQGVAFRFVYGVVPIRPGEIALAAFVYSHYTGEPGPMQPHDSETWAIEIRPEHSDVLRVDATCHGHEGELWESVLITATMPRQPIIL
jgi:hypothetical protein